MILPQRYRGFGIFEDVFQPVAVLNNLRDLLRRLAGVQGIGLGKTDQGIMQKKVPIESTRLFHCTFHFKDDIFYFVAYLDGFFCGMDGSQGQITGAGNHHQQQEQDPEACGEFGRDS